MDISKEVSELFSRAETAINKTKDYFILPKEITKEQIYSFFIELSMVKIDLVGLEVSLKHSITKEKKSALVTMKTNDKKRTLTDINAQIDAEFDDSALMIIDVALKRINALLTFLKDFTELQKQ